MKNYFEKIIEVDNYVLRFLLVFRNSKCSVVAVAFFLSFRE